MRAGFLAVLLAAASAAAGAWSVGVPLPERIQEHHGALYRGKIYVAGGIDSTNQTTKVAMAMNRTPGTK